jgi:hypothetical protein
VLMTDTTSCASSSFQPNVTTSTPLVTAAMSGVPLHFTAFTFFPNEQVLKALFGTRQIPLIAANAIISFPLLIWCS